MKFRNAYSKREPSKTNIDFTDIPSLAVQDQKESTDINNILRRFQETGLIDHVTEHEQQFGDFTNVDFTTQQNTVATIQSTFNELPSSVRKEFNNNPQEWIDFISLPENVEDMKDGHIDNLDLKKDANSVEVSSTDAVSKTADVATTTDAKV